MTERLAQDHGRAGERAVHVTMGAAAAEQHVARDAIVKERSALDERSVGIGQSRQGLVVHLDEIAGVGGLGRALGAQRGDGFADEARALRSEGRPLRGPEAPAFESR